MLLSNCPTLWLNLQQAFDLWHAQRRVDVSKIQMLYEVGE